MYLRRLLFSKLGQIYRDRKVVLNGMPTEGDGICCSSDKLADMTDSAEELRNSGAEELTTYTQFSSAFYRGVGRLEFEGLLYACSCQTNLILLSLLQHAPGRDWNGPSAVLGSPTQRHIVHKYSSL